VALIVNSGAAHKLMDAAKKTRVRLCFMSRSISLYRGALSIAKTIGA
jgi:hypothetical protein